MSLSGGQKKLSPMACSKDFRFLEHGVPAQPFLISSQRSGPCFLQERERSGSNISAMSMKVLPQVTKKDKNNMLINSNCRVIEPVIFQPNLSISCQVTMTILVQEGPKTLSARRLAG